MEKADRKTVTVSTGEILYWLFFGSLLFAKGIGLYDGQAVFKVILLFASCCLFAKLLIEEYTIAEYGKIVAVLGITALTYVVSGEKGLLLYGMMMAGMKNVNLKRIFTLGTIIWSVTFLGTTVSSLFRMDSTVYKVHAKLGLGHIFRWSLGYPHPNVLQVSYLLLAIFIIYMLGDKFRMKHAVWLFAGNCLVFLYSVSYTGFAVFMCLLLGRIYLLWRKRLNVAEKIVIQCIFPVCVFVSLVIPVTVTGRWFQILNKLLSTRMELAWRYLKPEYISLFGKRLSEITTESVTMDSAYLSAFITYGIIPFSILCLYTMYAIARYLSKKMYLETLIIVTIAVGGLTEPFLYNTSFKNVSFILMGALLYETGKGRAYRIIPARVVQNFNKQIELSFDRWVRLQAKFRNIYAFQWKKCAIAAICACICAIVVYGVCQYPKGYVVYRKDCADLTKEKHYYQEDNTAYKDFKRMKAFAEGEEIEYFSGNIVAMEKVRNEIAALCISYVIVYFTTGCRQEIRKERKCSKN